MGRKRLLLNSWFRQVVGLVSLDVCCHQEVINDSLFVGDCKEIVIGLEVNLNAYYP